MAETCFDCGATTTSYTTRWRADKMITSCKVCEHPPISDARVASPFSELTLDHVQGEDGRPLRVTSIHQLREAEKKYGFKHWASNMEEKNFDKPPQRHQPTIADVLTKEKKWLFPDVGPRMYEEMKSRGELI